MKSNGNSRYSIRMDNGKTYTQEEIESIIYAHERWREMSEMLTKEVEMERGMTDSCYLACENEANYGRAPKKKYYITINQAADFIERFGTHEFALFTSLMIHRTLGNRLSDNAKVRLDKLVHDMTDKRITPVTFNYYDKSTVEVQGDYFNVHNNKFR